MAWSPETWTILGLDPGGARPSVEAWEERVHPDDRAARRALHQQAVADREPTFWQRYRVMRPDGAVRMVESRSEIEYAPSGSVNRISAVLQDITERVAAEEALRSHAELINAVLAQAPLILLALDREGVFTMHEGSGLKAVGRSQGELVGECIWDWEPERQARLARVLAGESVHELVELRGRTHDVSYRPVLAEDGSIAGAVGVTVDVTDTLSLQEELRQAQKMEVVGQLAGGVAHDFNNLLMVINGLTDLLLQSAEQDDVRADLREILTAGERAAALTEQLLAFSRKQVLRPETVDPNEVIAKLLTLLRRVISEAVTIETDLRLDVGFVEVDPRQLEQALINLALNASQAMPDGGVLRIETSRIEIPVDADSSSGSPEPGFYVCLAVADSGVGMDRETQGRIFEPFFTTKEVGAGTGLGLASVDGFVQQSGGSITATSEVGSGTTFQIFLPPALSKPPRQLNARCGARVGSCWSKTTPPSAATRLGSHTITAMRSSRLGVEPPCWKRSPDPQRRSSASSRIK